jgi:hypothetical protein
LDDGQYAEKATNTEHGISSSIHRDPDRRDTTHISARPTPTTTTSVWLSTNCGKSSSLHSATLAAGPLANRLFCGDSCTTDHPQKIARAMQINPNHGTLAVEDRACSLECVITMGGVPLNRR